MQGFNRIIWATDYWDFCNADTKDIAEEFMCDLESSLGIKPTRISFRDQWKLSKPRAVGEASLDEYMNAVCWPQVITCGLY